LAGVALNVDVPAEGIDSISEAGEARPEPGFGTADAVVADGRLEPTSGSLDADGERRCPGVFDRVCEGLGDDVVDAGLDGGARTLRQVDGNCDRNR